MKSDDCNRRGDDKCEKEAGRKPVYGRLADIIVLGCCF